MIAFIQELREYIVNVNVVLNEAKQEILRLVNRNAELEQQIERMKCCENCGWYYLQQHWRESKEIDESRMFHCGTCGNKRNWKIKEAAK